MLPPVCGDAELFFELSLTHGRNNPEGYLILPSAPVLILQETGDRIRLVLERCEILQKQVGERQSAVIIDEKSSAYGFIAADMRFKQVDGWMPFMAARPFLSRPGRHDLHGYLDLSRTFAPDDVRLKVNPAVWMEHFKNFEHFQTDAA